MSKKQKVIPNHRRSREIVNNINRIYNKTNLSLLIRARVARRILAKNLYGMEPTFVLILYFTVTIPVYQCTCIMANNIRVCTTMKSNNEMRSSDCFRRCIVYYTMFFFFFRFFNTNSFFFFRF